MNYRLNQSIIDIFLLYNMMMRNNIYRSAAQVTIFSIFEKTLSFIYRIILSRSLGAEGLGIYQICLSFFSVFLTIAASGIPVTVSRLIAKHCATGKPHIKHAVVTSGILCSLVFTLPVSILLFFAKDLFSFLFPVRDYVNIFLILLPGLVLTSVYAVIRGSFWGNKQFLPYSIIELAEDAVMVVCGCILISFAHTAEGGAKAAVIAVLVSYIFSFAVSLFWYFFTGGKIVKTSGQFKPLFSAALPVTAMRTSTSILNSCVAMFLPALLSYACGYSNSDSLAIYGAVLGMSVPVLFIPSPLISSIAVVVAPQMSENFYSKRNDLLKRDIEKTLKGSVLIATVLIPAFFTEGRDVGLFLYDNVLSGEIIADFSFMMLPMSLSMITTTILNSMHYEIKTLIYYFIGAAAMLICIFGLTHFFGIYAYMVGVTLNFAINSVLNLRLLKKTCPQINYSVYALRCGVICVISCLFGWLFSNLLKDVLPLLIKIIVCGGIASLFALIAFYAMDLVTVKPIKKIFSRN